MSVSRDQAHFTLSENKVLLIDLNSKFGTFVRKEGIIYLDPAQHFSRERALSIMIHDNLMHFWIQP